MTSSGISKEEAGKPRAEAEWIDAAREGSEAAMEHLFRTHWAAAHRAAYLVARDWSASEDIAQEAFVRAVRSLDRFDRNRPFGPWLHRIVVNRAIDWCRRRAARREASEDDFHSLSTDAEFPDPYMRSKMQRALGSLSPEHRAVIVLRYYLEYTPGEIAGLLELNRGTVNSRLRRALDRLEAEFEEPAEGASR